MMVFMRRAALGRKASALVAEGNIDVAGGPDNLAFRVHRFGDTSDIGQAVLRDLLARKGHRYTKLPLLDEMRRVYAKLGGQHPVIGTGAAPALHVAGNDCAALHIGQLFQLGCGQPSA